MIRIYLAVTTMLALLASNAFANDWSADISSGYVSEYADRGTTVAGEQIQSNITLTNGAFSWGVTYARTIGDDRIVYDDEIDINIDYGFELGTITTVNIGADLIHVPSAGKLFDIGAADASTVEIYTGFSFDKAFAPSLTTIYDVHLKDFTLEATAAHAVDITDQSELVFNMIGGFAAIASADNNLYLTAGATYSHALSDNLNAFGGLYGGLSSEPTFTDASFPTGLTPIIKTSSTSAWIQIGLSAGF